MKKMIPAYKRYRPLDGREQICYTEKEWKELGSFREKLNINPTPKIDTSFKLTLREAVETIFPGAKHAGVANFIIRSLKNVNLNDYQMYENGLENLSKLSKLKYGRKFFDLNESERENILKNIEGTEFFERLRTHTMQGMFADPLYGGNRNMIGWNLLNYPGTRFHPITHTSRRWVTKDNISLKGAIRKNNDKQL